MFKLYLVPDATVRCKSWVNLDEDNTVICEQATDHTGVHNGWLGEHPISWANALRA